MTADELSTEQEEHLVYVMLREQGGIDPGRLGPVIDLAALGLVNAAWRNTCIEDWHAGGRMHDGDMMRVNSHMTWRARQILRRWTAENGLAADGPLSAVDSIPAQDIEWLAVRVYRWLVNPHRKLVTGITLADSPVMTCHSTKTMLSGGWEDSPSKPPTGAPSLAWHGPPRTERWPARTGGAIRAGLTWWIGC